MTNQMPERIKIARMGISYICPAWDKDEHATEYIRADLAQKTVTREVYDFIKEIADTFPKSDGDFYDGWAHEYQSKAQALISAGIVKVKE